VEVVSLATPTQVVIIALHKSKPPALLRQLLGDRSIEKIFHHAAFDVGFLRYRLDTNVDPVFCTKVAVRIAGVARNPTLETLTAELLGVTLDKGEQRSDWSVRPLGERQLEYAARDVLFLHQLKEVLERRLTTVGRWTLFHACMTFLTTRVELGLLGLDDVFAYRLPEHSEIGVT
jgi:ribonuclease D